MQNLIFSLNATIPVFFVMAAGYLLRRIGILNGGFVETLDKFNFRVTLPILLITDLGRADFYQVWDTRFVLYCFFVTLASIAAAALLSLPALKNRSERGEFIQASFRGSAAVLGIAFIQNIYGNAGMAPLMMLGAVPLYNVMTVVILSFTAPGSGGFDRQSIKKSMTKIVTNPLIIGIAAGLLLSLLRIELPLVVDKTLDQFAVTATPLALVSLGAGFEAKKAAARLKPALLSSFIKLMLQPAVFLPLAVYLGFQDAKMVAILIMLGSPTTVSAYIRAKNMGHEGTLTSGAIVITTLFSSVSITFWLFVLRTMGLI